MAKRDGTRSRRPSTRAPDAYDSPWKDGMTTFFKPFLALFFPGVHDEIDWAAGVEHLDVELRQVIRDAELSEQRADKLVKVRRIDGSERFLIVHVEVQSGYDSDLPGRIFTYNYRTFDRHRVPVVSLVVLGDTSPTWRPTDFGWDVWGCKMGIEYPVVKLMDYNERWSELEAETNPVALIAMAHLKTKETRGDTASRLAWKRTLVRMLYERGYERQEVLELYRLLDWMLKLPKKEEALFQEDLRRIEEELAMPYVTAIERMGEERGFLRGKQEGKKQGLEQGQKQGEIKILKRLMSRQYGPLPDWVDERLKKATPEDLERWTDLVLDERSLDDLFGSNGSS